MPTNYLDISVPVRPDMLVWSQDESVSVESIEIAAGAAPHRITALRMISHTGTHVDAPRHFIADGSTVDQIPPELLIGRARVYDLRGTRAITAEALAAAGVGDLPRALLKTDNSRWIRTGPMPDTPAHLTEDAARYLVAGGISLVGVDGLSVDHPEHAGAHLALLGAGVIVLETLDLSAVEPGDYHLTCLPLLIAGADGAPARAILRTR